MYIMLRYQALNSVLLEKAVTTALVNIFHTMSGN